MRKACRTATDPVCGMKVAKQNPRGTYEYQGETYLFCSPGCMVPPEQKGRAIDRRHTSI